MSTLSRSRAGFTLIEMLMAAAAGALILAVLVNVYGRAIKVRNASTEHLRESRLEARAYRVIRNDLLGARLSGGVMAATLQSGQQNANSKFPGDLVFDTTSGVIDEDNLAPELQEIEYYIGDDPSSPGGKAGALKRAISRNILAITPQVDKEETLLTGVTAMEVAFFDGTNWQDDWQTTSSDGSNSISIPTAIRLRFTLSPESHPATTRKTIEVLVPWTTKVAIPPAPTTTPATGA